MHIVVQFSKYHLIEEVIFAPLYILASFVRNKVPIGVWVYSWLSILFHWSIFLSLYQYHTVLMIVALQYNLKSGRLIPPALFFLKTALVIQDLLCLHMNCEMFCSSSVKNAIGDFIGITLNLLTAFGSIVIFTILILPIQEYGISLHLLQFSSVKFSRSVVSDSLRPHESQHSRPSCPSPSPGVHSDSRPSST